MLPSQQRRQIIVRATPAYLPGPSSSQQQQQQQQQPVVTFAAVSSTPSISMMSLATAGTLPSTLASSSSTSAAASSAAAAAAAAAKRRRIAGPSAATASHQLSDRAIRLAPECGAHRELSRLEQRLDEAILARRLALHEAQRRQGQPRPKRRFRLQLSSHFGAYGPAGEQGWELRIEGRALDDASPLTTSSGGLTTSSSTVSAASLLHSGQSGAGLSHDQSTLGGPNGRRRFTSYLNSLVVELDRGLYGPDQHLAEWNRAEGLPDTDGFVVRRAGESPVRVTVLLTPEQRPPRYRLQPQLGRLLGLHTGTQAQAAHAFWRYVAAKSLLDPLDRACLVLDQPLGELFRSDGQASKEPVRIPTADVPRRLAQLLLPMEPLSLNYLVSAEAGVKRCVNYELELDAEDSGVLSAAAEPVAMSGSTLQELNATESRISDTLDQMNSAAEQAEFFADFASNPQQFLTSALLKSGGANSTSQQQPQSQRQQQPQADPDKERRAAFFQGGWLPEATAIYFAEKIDKRRQELEELLGIP
ncbi:hypothetical protein BOX15_Mlig012934g3 [Macrostomum lignano]|uniref:DM2 domain-containing protein n=1 Tax=Macrostomum lignano TaxID=282301 RepID=A0A267H8J0_9PLAT|nr:hypothetical protein BOX15_Mlig012934g3 [Macrostomum lignano]